MWGRLLSRGAGWVLLVGVATGAEPSSSELSPSLLSIAGPVSPVNTLQLLTTYTDIRSGGNSTLLDLRNSVRMKYFLIPGIEVPGFYSVVRVDLRVLSLNTPRASATGLTDTFVFDVTVRRFSWGGIGFGPSAIFPTATDAILGQGKLQLGPTFGVVLIKPRPLFFGFLAAQIFSIAGDATRPDQSTLFFLPFISVFLPKNFFLQSNPIMVFNWKNDEERTVIPVNLAIGRAFSPTVAGYIQPEWIATGRLQNSFLVRLNISYAGW